MPWADAEPFLFRASFSLVNATLSPFHPRCAFKRPRSRQPDFTNEPANLYYRSDRVSAVGQLDRGFIVKPVPGSNAAPLSFASAIVLPVAVFFFLFSNRSLQLSISSNLFYRTITGPSTPTLYIYIYIIIHESRMFRKNRNKAGSKGHFVSIVNTFNLGIREGISSARRSWRIRCYEPWNGGTICGLMSFSVWWMSAIEEIGDRRERRTNAWLF